MSDASNEPSDHGDAARLSAIAAGALGAVFTVGGFAVGGPKTGLSVAIGAGIAVLNLVTLRAIIGALLTPADEDESPAEREPEGAEKDPVAEAEAAGTAEAERDPNGDAPQASSAEAKQRGRRGGAAWGVFAMLKILVLFGGIALLLRRGWVEAIPLVVGYGVLPLGITASTLLGSLRPASRPGRRRPRR